MHHIKEHSKYNHNFYRLEHEVFGYNYVLESFSEIDECFVYHLCEITEDREIIMSRNFLESLDELADTDSVNSGFQKALMESLRNIAGR